MDTISAHSYLKLPRVALGLVIITLLLLMLAPSCATPSPHHLNNVRTLFRQSKLQGWPTSLPTKRGSGA